MKREIIDMHVHAAGIGAGSECFISERMRSSLKYKVFLRSFGVTEKEVMEHGDEIIIRKLSEQLSRSEYVRAAVVLAMDGAVDSQGKLDPENTEFYVPGEYVAREVQKYNNLYYGASINPYRPDAINRLDAAAEQGAVLVKWLPAIQHIDPADKRLIPFYLRMKELGMPLLTHTGDEHSFTKARNELSDPKRLELPLSLGVTVIAAHMATTGKNGGEENIDRLLSMFSAYPNLYADLSSLTQINKMRYLRKVLRHTEVHGRLLYGTDMPLPQTGIASPVFHTFKLSPRELISILQTDNPWDKDVALKRSIGFPEEIFENAASVLRIKNRDSMITVSMRGEND
ncbi:MAG: metal-dependent hydrolase [Nitrospiraceae bacterium]|nr:MAG: metal-dependent hydrolase [Nitrospiraceae bacterium]